MISYGKINVFNFIINIYPKILTKVFSPFDISSGIIVGLWSVVFLVGCAYSIWTTKQVTTPVAMIFSTVISAFAGHKIVQVWTDKNPTPSPSQGDNNGDNSKQS